MDEEALKAGVYAMAPDRIQGFMYKDEYVIRDVFKPHGPEQELWRGPATSMTAHATYELQVQVERFRLGVAAFLEASAKPASEKC